MKTHLVIDVHSVAYRVFYGLKHQFSYNDIQTTVAFGFFTQLLMLMGRFQTTDVIFVFDFGKVLRKEVYPQYKRGRRKDLDDEGREQLKQLRLQINNLRSYYLPKLGFKNVLFQRGYESDDVIASICFHSIPRDDKVVIVSSDGDLFQLLTDRVIMYNISSKKPVTLKSFQDEYGISAVQWADAKAIAGCRTDNVEGIRGIGEKTACKFIGGTLKPTTEAHKKIVDGRDIWQRNLVLVQLPYEGTEKFELRGDRTTNKKWFRVMRELDIKSLAREQPFGR